MRLVYSIVWIFWLAWFAAWETAAFVTNSVWTFSDFVWRFEDLNLQQPYDFPMWTATHWIAALLMWFLFAWLSLHLPFGLLRT